MRLTDTSDLWWKSAVVYCLDVEKYLDWNGDGVGDFSGLAHRLDYLAELGVTCLWLMPFSPTAQRDDGYDITDFYGVDPRLGHVGDVVEVIRTARDRGIRVIADLVLNHTSDEHPWFEESRSSRDSPLRDFYVWVDEPPADSPAPVFPGEETSVWEHDPATGQYYLHNFYKTQPDLNIAEPRVREEVAKIIGYWMQLGLSGFRVDAVPFFIEDDGDRDPHDYLRQVRGFLSRRSGEAMLLGEVNLHFDQQLRYFGGPDGDELTMQFDFIGMQKLWLSMARRDARPLAQSLVDRPAIARENQWANFVRNHDELTLDKLTDDERNEVFDAFAPEEHQRVYGRGIVRRAPAMLGGDARRIRMLYSLLFSLPGTPVLFYGEEIGMSENPAVEGREAVRTPMQWTRDPGGGFSAADAADVVTPVVEGEYGPEAVNVAQQRRDPDSLLSFVRLLIARTRNSPELGWGEFTLLDQPHAAVLAHQLWNDEGRLIALHNLGDEPVTVPLHPEGIDADTRFVELLGAEEHVVDADGLLEVDLGPYGCSWLRVSGPYDGRIA